MKNKLLAICALIFLSHISAGYAGMDEATAAYDKSEYAIALKNIQPLAEQGNAAAQNLFGLMYFNGNGVPKDYKQASAWYRKAAEQGLAEAQHNLGFSYFLGAGVPHDNTQAIDWYRKAANNGLPNAQYNLGQMYDKGQGVAQDYAQAAVWYRKAAAQNNIEAQNRLFFVEEILRKEELKAAVDQQIKDDIARGYQYMSFTDFQLDSKIMPQDKKLVITGYYQVKGQLEYLVETYTGAIMSNVYRLFLLTEPAPREARKQLLDLRGSLCGMNNICKTTILGHVSKCNITWLETRVLTTKCLVVDEVRNEP